MASWWYVVEQIEKNGETQINNQDVSIGLAAQIKCLY